MTIIRTWTTRLWRRIFGAPRERCYGPGGHFVPPELPRSGMVRCPSCGVDGIVTVHWADDPAEQTS